MGLETISSSLDRGNELSFLIQKPKEMHIGYIIRMRYDNVDILTNDHFKERAGGVPQNSFLIATAFDPANYSDTKVIDKIILLLRVQGPHRLPQDDENLTTLIEHLQNREEVMRSDERDGIEPITHSLLQFGGITCNILGTFFLDESGRLQLGADAEDFQSVAHMRVYKPIPEALGKIVNYIDPIKRKKAIKDAEAMGFNHMPKAFEIGKVRYTSTNRLQKLNGVSEVIVRIQPTDFISRRTAVLGMTRTGKSNTIKTTVSAVAMAAANAKIGVGQLIFDMNGEYANANGQDDGSSIAEVFSDDVVRYRGVPTKGFFDLRDNFYKSLDAGLSILQEALATDPSNRGQDMQALIGLSLAKPGSVSGGPLNRWLKTAAIYKSLLNASGFEPAPDDNQIKFPISEKVLEQIFSETFVEIANDENEDVSNRKKKAEYVKTKIGDPKGGLTLDEAKTFFTVIRSTDRSLLKKNKAMPIGIESSTKGKSWLEQSDRGLLNLLAGLSDNDGRIRSTRTIYNAGKDYHSPKGSKHIPSDIYRHLENGRIVILDLSVGTQSVRETLSKQIAQYVLKQSSEKFTEKDIIPPRIVIYVEEAHNLIGKSADFNTVWPRIAKEGAKYGIALVYATQEPSSVHPNIMANTENFFVTHLNNDDELRALGKYYDFSDFTNSLKKAQDVGFARIKTLSSPYVVPTQIRLFEPKELKSIYDNLPRRTGFTPSPIPFDN